MTFATSQLLPKTTIEQTAAEIKRKRISLDMFVDRDAEATNLLELSRRTKLNINTMQVYLNEMSRKSMDILASMTECKKCKVGWNILIVYYIQSNIINKLLIYD